MDAAFIVYLTLAFLALFCLALVLVIHCLPVDLKGLWSGEHINTVLLLLVVNAAVRSAIAAVDVAARRGPVECSIDSIWTLYTTTVMCATLVPLAAYHQVGCMGRRWSPIECVAHTAPVYVYGLIPVIWVLVRGDQLEKLDNGLGAWWGTYCVPDLAGWRTVRLVSLLTPLVLAVLGTLNAVRLARHPMAVYLLTKPSASVVANLLALSLLGILYLALEATVGWKARWWPRAFEPLFCLLILAQADFVPYADVLTDVLTRGRYRLWRRTVPPDIESPTGFVPELKGAEGEYDDPDPFRAQYRRFTGKLTPIPEGPESPYSTLRDSSLPAIAVLHPTPSSEISFDPLNRAGACAPSPTPRYSNPFADEKTALACPLSPASEPERPHSPTPYRSHRYSLDSEDEPHSPGVPPNRYPLYVFNPDDDDEPLPSPHSVGSAATFGQRSRPSRLSFPPDLPQPQQADDERATTPLLAPRAPFADDSRLSVGSAVSESSNAGSFVTASAGSYRSPSPSPSHPSYYTAGEGARASTSSVAVEAGSFASGVSLAADGTELPNGPDGRWSVHAAPRV